MAIRPFNVDSGLLAQLGASTKGPAVPSMFDSFQQGRQLKLDEIGKVRADQRAQQQMLIQQEQLQMSREAAQRQEEQFEYSKEQDALKWIFDRQGRDFSQSHQTAILEETIRSNLEREKLKQRELDNEQRAAASAKLEKNTITSTTGITDIGAGTVAASLREGTPIPAGVAANLFPGFEFNKTETYVAKFVDGDRERFVLSRSDGTRMATGSVEALARATSVFKNAEDDYTKKTVAARKADLVDPITNVNSKFQTAAERATTWQDTARSSYELHSDKYTEAAFDVLLEEAFSSDDNADNTSLMNALEQQLHEAAYDLWMLNPANAGRFDVSRADIDRVRHDFEAKVLADAAVLKKEEGISIKRALFTAIDTIRTIQLDNWQRAGLLPEVVVMVDTPEGEIPQIKESLLDRLQLARKDAAIMSSAMQTLFGATPSAASSPTPVASPSPRGGGGVASPLGGGGIMSTARVPETPATQGIDFTDPWSVGPGTSGVGFTDPNGPVAEVPATQGIDFTNPLEAKHPATQGIDFTNPLEAKHPATQGIDFTNHLEAGYPATLSDEGTNPLATDVPEAVQGIEFTDQLTTPRALPEKEGVELPRFKGKPLTKRLQETLYNAAAAIIVHRRGLSVGEGMEALRKGDVGGLVDKLSTNELTLLGKEMNRLSNNPSLTPQERDITISILESIRNKLAVTSKLKKN